MKHSCFLLKESRIPLIQSSFGIPIIHFPEISDERLVLFVRNAEEVRSDGSKKPAGYGNPGGGVKPVENPTEAVIREVWQETGLKVIDAREVRYEHSLLTPKAGGGWNYIRCNRLEYLMKEEEFELDFTTMRQTLVHVFMVRVDWAGSKLRNLFLLRYGVEKASCENPLEFGLAAKIPPDMAERLEIIEARESEGQRQEIDEIILFPESATAALLETRTDFYVSHLRRLERVLDVA